MVVINQFTEPTSELFAPDGTKIGDLTSAYQVNDVCIQIKEQKLSGYYIMFEDQRVDIDFEGRIYQRPYGFYDTFGDQIRDLIG